METQVLGIDDSVALQEWRIYSKQSSLAHIASFKQMWYETKCGLTWLFSGGEAPIGIECCPDCVVRMQEKGVV